MVRYFLKSSEKFKMGQAKFLKLDLKDKVEEKFHQAERVLIEKISPGGKLSV